MTSVGRTGGRTVFVVLLAALAAVLTAACGSGTGNGAVAGADQSTIGDIPDDQVFIAYAAPGGVFTVKVPEGWTMTSDAAGVSFTDKLNTIRIEASATAPAPTTAAAQADLTTIRAGASGFAGGEVSTVTRPAGVAVLTTYRADAPVDPVTGKVINDDVERYQFFHAPTRVTITLSGPHGADNVDPWRVVTDSLMWTP